MASADHATPRAPAPERHVFTIGHSTQSIDAFCSQLTTPAVTTPAVTTPAVTAPAITTLADIRSIPGSNRNPQFHADALARALAQVGITYVHIADLGGRRKRQHDVAPTLNAGWRNRSFHNYADYTTTDAFASGLDELAHLDGPVAVMCAEALPWRCHRTIVSDNLVALGAIVTHLIGATTKRHVLGAWGPRPHVEGTTVTYPVADATPTYPSNQPRPVI